MVNRNKACGGPPVKRRRALRFKTRTLCRLLIDGRHYSGVILNVSPLGCFAQTSAQPAIGAQVDARIYTASEESPVAIVATVANKQLVPPPLRTLAHGGIGMSIRYAPESYYSFLASLSTVTSKAT